MGSKIANQETATVDNILLSEANFRPMLFPTPMVQALLNGTKTQTRRIIKEQYKWDDFRILTNSNDDFLRICEVVNGPNGNTYMERDAKKLPINIGDIIWVRETCAETCDEFGSPIIVYKTGNPRWIGLDDDGENQLLGENKCEWSLDNYPACGKWTPSLFMKKWQCRLWLKVINVRVERLQEISEEDAKNEGIERWTDERLNSKPVRYAVYFQDCKPEDAMSYTSCPIDSYETLWQKINGKDSWYKNPFVWVYDFEVMREAPFGFR
jgi:hypothetical protein